MQSEHINLKNDVQNTPTKKLKTHYRIDMIHAEMYQIVPNRPISSPNLHSHLKNSPRLLEKASLTFQDPVTILIPALFRLQNSELPSKTMQNQSNSRVVRRLTVCPSEEKAYLCA